jgi:hypothetical protein
MGGQHVLTLGPPQLWMKNVATAFFPAGTSLFR